MQNLAFIDGQNLYMGTHTGANPWEVDLQKFRIYLQKKYNVSQAYYFLGYSQEKNEDLYFEIKEAGFILSFRQHNAFMIGNKKGNVDTEIVFQIMKQMWRKEVFNKIVLVSGDGDYKMLVDFLIEEGRLEKILFPNKRFVSSLYGNLPSGYFDHIENGDVKDKISK